MSHTGVLAVLGATALAAALGASEAAPPLTYRFDEVKSKVVKAPGGEAAKGVRVAAGDTAAGGDTVTTGFWGRAVISVAERKARFEIASSTRVRLGRDEPGVLLSLEKGRLEAFFEALTGEPAVERRVAAPGALLAVRGTRYGLEVGADGEALVAVFEGVVEVIPTAPGIPPVRVGPRHYCTFSPRVAPRPAPMAGTGMSERSWGRREAPPREGGDVRQGPGQKDGPPAGKPPIGSPQGGPPQGGQAPGQPPAPGSQAPGPPPGPPRSP